MDISLRHNNHTLPQRVESFYDGLAVAVDGVLTLDSSELTHLQAAYFRGYNTTMDGRRLNGFTDLDAYITETMHGGQVQKGLEEQQPAVAKRGTSKAQRTVQPKATEKVSQR